MDLDLTPGSSEALPVSDPDSTVIDGNGAGHETEGADEPGDKGQGASAPTDDGDTFWSGDPSELEGDERARYLGFQRAYTQKTEALAREREEAQAQRDDLARQQAELQQLAVQFQARLAAEDTPPSLQGGERESGPARDELRKRFDRGVADGRGFESIVELVEELSSHSAAGVVSERESALMAKIDDLESRLGSIDEGTAGIRRDNKINRVFEQLKSGRYKGDFESPKVQAAMRAEMGGGDPVIARLLSNDDVETALVLAGERAIRTVNDDAVVNRASRRAEAKTPTSETAPSLDVQKTRKDFDSTRDWVKHVFGRPENQGLVKGN